MILISTTAYAVSGVDLNDGYPRVFSYWSREADAESEAAKLNKDNKDFCAVVSVRTVFMDTSNDDTFYDIPRMERIVVDPPSIQTIKAKLSDKELAVLGIKR